MLLIAGGRVIDPSSGLDRQADVLIRDGKVESILFGNEPVSPDVPCFAAAGKIVAPGFVDVHAHLRYPGQADKETIASGTSAAVRGGFTTVCAMANTLPAVDSGAGVETVLSRLEDEARCHVQTFGAVSRGLAGQDNTDAAELVGAGALGLSDDGNPVVSSDVMKQALVESARLGVPVSAHEELKSIDGASPSDPRWSCPGEVMMVRRDIDLLRATGGKLHIAHVSCRESLGLIADAKAEGLAITAEATPHHLTLTDDVWMGNESLPPNHGFSKVNPPLRGNEDRRALIAALNEGLVDAVATDHAPHTLGEKCRPPDLASFGFTAFELALPLLLELVQRGLLDLQRLVQRLTSGPAGAIGVSGGSLHPGSRADICVFDPEETWTPVRDTIVSKGKNHPLMGHPLRGRVVATVVGGRVFEFGRDHGLRALRAS